MSGQQLFVFLALATTDGGTPAGSGSEPAADQEQACPGRGGGYREGAGAYPSSRQGTTSLGGGGFSPVLRGILLFS